MIDIGDGRHQIMDSVRRAMEARGTAYSNPKASEEAKISPEARGRPQAHGATQGVCRNCFRFANRMPMESIA